MTGRITVQASAIADYMGLGFNTPEDRLLIDLGLKEPIFSKDQKERMELGTILENSVLDFFEGEGRLGEKIYDRNTEVRYAFDGMVRYKIDGRTDDAVVDCKVSASAQSFIFNKGYEVQLQTYMVGEGLNKAILLGLDNGKPVQRVFTRNQEMIDDIEHILNNVTLILTGILPIEELDLSIAEKYSGDVFDEKEALEFDVENDKELVEEFAKNNENLKKLEKRQDVLKKYFQSKYPFVEYKDEDVSIKITQRSRKGGLDEARFVTNHPDIDLDNYRKDGSSYKVVTIKSLQK